MFQTEPENGRGYQRATRSERSSIWTFAAFSLTEPHWNRLRASRFLRHRSPTLFSTKVAVSGRNWQIFSQFAKTHITLQCSEHRFENLRNYRARRFADREPAGRNLLRNFFEHLKGRCCLISLVKAIRVRVRCLANSLVVPGPDHLFTDERQAGCLWAFNVGVPFCGTLRSLLKLKSALLIPVSKIKTSPNCPSGYLATQR